MDRQLQNRVLAVVLAVATVVVCVFGVLNFLQESSFEQPTDGVWWMEAGRGLAAQRVPAESSAHRAGVRVGDLLVSADDQPIHSVAGLERQMGATGTWGHLNYGLVRNSSPLTVQVILEPTDRSKNQGLRMIALVYLAIGLYVLFRRWTAPKATHFYVFCLVSAVLYGFKYTGRFDTVDWIIFWTEIVATSLQPALFLHFAVTFGQGAADLRRRIVSTLLYVPGAAVALLQLTAMLRWSATGQLSHRLEQISTGYIALYYVIAAAVFWLRYRRSDKPLERQQLKWLTRGTLLSVAPYTFLNAIPYMADGAVSPTLAKVEVFFLVFLPLTFAWAIVRYRLMDTDLIFKRGVTYTLATAALVGVYFGTVAISAEVVHTRLPSLRIWGLLAAIVATALIFEPIKNAIQGRVDRIFDQKRYDYRETLIEFSRGLSSETNLPALSRSIVERLSQTLLVARVAVFIAPDGTGAQGYALVASHGLSEDVVSALPSGSTGFFSFGTSLEQGHIFFENPASLPHLPELQQRVAALLDMNYYLPCRVANPNGSGTRTIAVIGLGRTQDGDFLSSEDMELLESLAGYIGIAIQNAQLFRRLNQQIAEFERLKEFNENIVESIKVGIFTLDLEDRIESWNAEMEVMYALSRSEALGRHVSEIFPESFMEQFLQVQGQAGTHHLSKVKLDLRTGESRTANLAVAPLLTREFVSVGSIVMIEDITERTRLEGQLTQAEKLSSIGLLAAGVAHEVNTPLAVISSYAQMLQKYTRDDQRLGPVLDKITQQTFRASEIVNGLLNFSRTTATEFSPLDLNAVVRETMTLLDHQFRTGRITVKTEFQTPLARIMGSHGKLQQVVLNLMLNAKDAMSDMGGGTLTLRTFDNGKEVLLQVSDTGSGIDPVHLHRIYDPFFTTKNAPRQGQHKGTGLGLAVSYGIVQEHSGRIHVESEVGAGTSFFLHFPALEEVAPATAPARTIHA